jgi:hypothetical protein
VADERLEHDQFGVVAVDRVHRYDALLAPVAVDVARRFMVAGVVRIARSAVGGGDFGRAGNTARTDERRSGNTARQDSALRSSKPQ